MSQITEVTGKNLKEIKKILLQEKANILNKPKKGLLEEHGETRGDIMDLAVTEGKLNLSLALQNREHYYLLRIEQALERVERGVFGFCENCEDSIPLRRLQINPVTELCVNCQEKIEVESGCYTPPLPPSP